MKEFANFCFKSVFAIAVGVVITVGLVALGDDEMPNIYFYGIPLAMVVLVVVVAMLEKILVLLADRNN